MSSTTNRSGQTNSHLDRKRRRVLALGAIALVAPLGVFAQPPGKVLRVGFLVIRNRPPSIEADHIGGFVRGMRELGYVEGKNLVIEWRFADSKAERLAALAAELVAQKVDVIVTAGTQPTAAAQKATSTIPIVMGNANDPVGSGFIKSLGRPGGNITGASNVSVELGAKHLEMLLAMVPKLNHVVLLVNPTNRGHAALLEHVEAAAKTVSVRITTLEAQDPQEIEAAISAMVKAKTRAFIVASDGYFNQQSKQIAQLAMKHRLASIYTWVEYAESGGLMSYGPSHDGSYHRAATYVDKIFKGTKPADLPVEQPTRFKLTLNRKTAQSFGLAVPYEIVLRAERVIE